jgi:hypothetical protein
MTYYLFRRISIPALTAHHCQVTARIMYHHTMKKFRSLVIGTTVAALQIASGNSFSAIAETIASSVPLTSAPLEGKVGQAHEKFPQPPTGHALKQKSTHAELFEYDKTPLGNRQPFLLVHGLRGEFYPTFRWTRVAKAFVADPAFNKIYKVYFLRYSTVVSLTKTVPEFRQELAKLSLECEQRPVSIMALSMGGNLVQEAMLDKDTNQAIKFVLTLGTPFHGSPLFTRNWVQYSIYKNFAMPWTRVDHSLAFRMYFHHNPNLEQDLPWDNADGAIPNVGKFWSILPLGPEGVLTPENSTNTFLADVNNQHFDKKKFVTYSGYLNNPYMESELLRVTKTTILAPYTLVSMKLPAHLAREHAVLKMLNCVIGSVVSSKTAISEAKTPFLYQLNDGITPVSSALFLPEDAFKKAALANEADLPALKELTDVRVARVFRNIDHLSFIDGVRPAHGSELLKDELNPKVSSKRMFQWMLNDILDFNNASVVHAASAASASTAAPTIGAPSEPPPQSAVEQRTN